MLNLFKKYWREIWILISIICGFVLIKSCSNRQDEVMRQKHNVAVEKDSVRYYRDENGKLYADKLSYISTINELKQLNSELYENIKSLNKKIIAGVNATIVVHDTIPKTDTLYVNNNPIQQFTIPFKDDILNGNIDLNYHFNNNLSFLEMNSINYTMELPVEVYFTKDYSVILKATGKDNVQFNNVKSFIDPIFYGKTKQKRYGVGLSGGIGVSPYNLVNGKWGVYAFPYIGLSFNYNLLSF